MTAHLVCYVRSLRWYAMRNARRDHDSRSSSSGALCAWRAPMCSRAIAMREYVLDHTSFIQLVYFHFAISLLTLSSDSLACAVCMRVRSSHTINRLIIRRGHTRTIACECASANSCDGECSCEYTDVRRWVGFVCMVMQCGMHAHRTLSDILTHTL